MIVEAVISTDLTTTEESLHQLKCSNTLRPLNHRESWLNLPTRSTRSIQEDRNAETSFAVDKADDPLRKVWPFLLIVRTGRIFTTHATHRKTRMCHTNEYRRILGVSSI